MSQEEDLWNMTNIYHNITDNPDNYGTARFISWGLMIPSFVVYALLTWCYFEDPEILTKLFQNIFWKSLLRLFRPLIYVPTYIVRYVKAKTNPNDFSQYQRYEDCRRLWGVIRRVEIGVENTGQLILQLWLFRPYINLVLNWSLAEVLRNLWNGLGNMIPMANIEATFEAKMFSKFILSSVLTCGGITMIRVKKSYETENDLSKMIIYFFVCFLQLFGRLMTLRIFFLIDMDNIWHIVWIVAHILVELICIKLLFECPPLPNKGQNIKKVCLLPILSFKDPYTHLTSLEQLLSLTEFSGEKARPKVYENDHKNVLAIWLDLVANVKIWAHF